MDLQTLIATRRGDRSYQDLADISGMPKATWGSHASPREDIGRRLPDTDTIRGIARGLDVDVEVVYRAMGVTMGILKDDPDRPPLLDLLPPRDVLARLTPEDVDTVVRLVRLLADRSPVPAQGPRGGRSAAAARTVPLATVGA